MTILYVDIESFFDVNRLDLFAQKPDETPEDFHKRMALDPDMLTIIGLNYALNDQPARSGWAGECNPDIQERDLLTTFWSLVKKADIIVGFNILGFDLPSLLTRSAVLGVPPVQGFTYWNLKPWESYVVDLFKRRYQYTNKTQAKSLKELRRIFSLSIPAEFDEVLALDGGSVEALYLQWMGGDDEALRLLKLYGRCDVETTRALYQFWRGYFVP